MHLPDRAAIEEILKETKEPETGLSIKELGLVKRIDYIEKEAKLIITVDFRRRNPSCLGCLPIAWHLQKSITDQLAERFLRYRSIKAVEFRDLP